ncbi:MAG TPA: DUF1573 domain-containing protein [Tepidisphaeraceae bacterium]|nr:DUF1573 domain-containing protein [Tepidisphaeraceae bacterium]
MTGAWIVHARHNASGPQVTEVAGLYADARLVNFESAEPGTRVAGAFHLVNRGASNIDILGVTTSCGCVVAHVPPQTLSPAAGLSIPFTIALPGDAIDPQVSRQVIVRVKSAGREQTVSLRVAATLKTTTPLVAIPGRADFGIVSAGAPASKRTPAPPSLFCPRRSRCGPICKPISPAHSIAANRQLATRISSSPWTYRRFRQAR